MKLENGEQWTETKGAGTIEIVSLPKQSGLDATTRKGMCQLFMFFILVSPAQVSACSWLKSQERVFSWLIWPLPASIPGNQSRNF